MNARTEVGEHSLSGPSLPAGARCVRTRGRASHAEESRLQSWPLDYARLQGLARATVENQRLRCWPPSPPRPPRLAIVPVAVEDDREGQDAGAVTQRAARSMPSSAADQDREVHPELRGVRPHLVGLVDGDPDELEPAVAVLRLELRRNAGFLPGTARTRSPRSSPPALCRATARATAAVPSRSGSAVAVSAASRLRGGIARGPVRHAL